MKSNTELEVFKVDRRGRVHVPAARREELLNEFERSGASAPEFARLVGVKYATFAGWRARRGRTLQRAELAAEPAAGREVERPSTVPFFEAVVETAGPQPGSGLVVELLGGRVLITARTQLPWAAELLHLLAPRGSRPC